MATILRVSKVLATAPNGVASGSITVPQYDASKTILFISIRGDTGEPEQSLFRFTKSTSTSIGWQRNTVGAVHDMVLYLAEFQSGVSVQDVSRSGEGTVSFTAVNAAETFPISLGNTNAGTVLGPDDVLSLDLTGPGSNVDTANFQSSVGTSTAIVGAQIVTWTGANVTKILQSLVGDWTQPFAPALTGPVLVSSGRETDINMRPDRVRIFTAIPGANLTAASVTNAAVGDVATFVAELNDRTQDQHILAGPFVPATNNVAISAVDRARSVSFWETESQIPFLSRGDSQSDLFGELLNTLDLTTPTNLQIQFALASGNKEISAAVFEFAYPFAVSLCRVTDDLLMLYKFDEGSGSIVGDSGGVGFPTDLTIATPANVTWDAVAPDTLRFDGTTCAQSGSSADKFIQAAIVTNEFTFEAWIRPDALGAGEQKILTNSPSSALRNATQYLVTSSSGSRIRNDTSTDNNGAPAVTKAAGFTIGTLKHFVVTRDTAGNTIHYIDGVQVGSTTTQAGTLINWDQTYEFAIANEITNVASLQFLGSYYLAAVYSRALTSAEVLQNFEAGPNDDGCAAAATPYRSLQECNCSGMLM